MDGIEETSTVNYLHKPKKGVNGKRWATKRSVKEVNEQLKVVGMIGVNSSKVVESKRDNTEAESPETFVQNMECLICLNEYTTTQYVVLLCKHIICEECFVLLIRQVNEKRITPECPVADCNQKIEYDFICGKVPLNVLVNYHIYLDENLIESFEDIINCPKRDCGGFVVLTDRPTFGRCQTCNHTFCTNCNEAYHGDTACDNFESDAEKKKILEMYVKGEQRVKHSLEMRYTKRKLENLKAESLSSKYIKRKCKACPFCGAKIEKTSGCNHIMCTKCKSHFCWACSRIMHTSDISRHVC